LGLEATRDRAVIRRAYAARLKLTNPEDDPAGFQALRAAYERALAYAGPAPGGAAARRREPPVVVPEVEVEPRAFEELLEVREAPDEAGDGTPRPERSRDWRPAAQTEAKTGDGGARSHGWRSPDPSPPPDPQPGKLRAWRPADPPPEIFDETVRRDYAARTDALTRLAADAAATPEALQAALAAFLASPMLEDMARHSGAERWLAALITRNTPRTDPLLAPAIAYFGWDATRVGPRSDAGARVLARREDLRFLQTSRVVGNVHHGALAALTRKPARWRWVLNRLTFGLGRRVRDFLAVIRTERPGLIASLDADAVAWWDRYLARPRLGPIAILATTAALAMTLIAWAAEDPAQLRTGDPLAPLELILASVVTVVLVNLFGVQWPRTLWRERWARIAPAWARYAWAPALATTVIAASLVPASLPATIALAALTAPLLLWSVAVGEPDQRQAGFAAPGFRWRGPIISFPIAFGVYLAYWGVLRPGVRFPWRAMTAFGFAYLAIFWVLVTTDLPADAWGQMSAPLLAAAIAFSVGAGTLADGWNRLQPTLQRRALIGLAGLVALAVAAIFLARDYAPARPAAAALVAAAVFAHKTPARALFGEPAQVRDLVMRFGWVLFAWMASNIGELATNWTPPLVLLGVIAAVILIAAAQRARQPVRQGWTQRLATSLRRYGWLAVVPIVDVVCAGRETLTLEGGGLWLLTGVGLVLASLATPPREAGAR
jgi:hypothetical protein